MDIDSISERIDQTVRLVFQCNFSEVIKNTLDIVEYIQTHMEFSKEENKKAWEQVTNYLVVGLENKDYLVVGDILKYELTTILESENDCKGAQK